MSRPLAIALCAVAAAVVTAPFAYAAPSASHGVAPAVIAPTHSISPQTRVFEDSDLDRVCTVAKTSRTSMKLSCTPGYIGKVTIFVTGKCTSKRDDAVIIRTPNLTITPDRGGSVTAQCPHYAAYSLADIFDIERARF